jgi:hypothetical protein
LPKPGAVGVMEKMFQRHILAAIAAGRFPTLDAIMKQIPKVEEKLFMSSLNICP